MSEISFSKNVRHSRRLEICGSLGIPEVEKHQRYLGLPTMIGKTKKSIFGELKERVRKKLKDWKGRTLSAAGKEVLIKSIAQAQVIYPMMVFKIPDGIIDDIQRQIAWFWWGQKGEERKIPWIKWEALCDSKEEGGLGFKDLRKWNIALLGKQIWNLMERPNSLVARVLKMKYYHNSDISQAKLGSSPSYVWRSLMAAKSELAENFRWRVGNGQSIRIWNDQWLPGECQNTPIPPVGIFDPEERVDSLMLDGNAGWDLEQVTTKFRLEDKEQVLKIPIPVTPQEDKKIWKLTDNGIYTVRSGYQMLQQRDELRQERIRNNRRHEVWFRKKLWKLNIPPKVNHFMWRMCQESLPVGMNLARRLEEGKLDPDCPLCGLAESQSHCLRDCAWVRRQWQQCPDTAQFEDGESMSCGKWLETVFLKHEEEKVQRLCAIMWVIWRERCGHLFNGAKMKEEEIIPRGLDWLYNYLEVHVKERSRRNTEQGNLSWSAPDPGIFKLNTDAGLLRPSGVGFGAIIRDWNGRCWAALARREEGHERPIVAEAKAIIGGLKEANRRGLFPLVIEADCLPLVQKLKKAGAEDDWSELAVWCEQIRQLAEINEGWSGRKVEFVQVPRKCNSVAHRLAHLVEATGTVKIWVDRPPEAIKTLLWADRSNMYA